MRVRFKHYCPPYVRGDEVTVDSVKAKKFVEQGVADFVYPMVEKPAEKEVPAAPKKRGRPRKNPVPSPDGD